MKNNIKHLKSKIKTIIDFIMNNSCRIYWNANMDSFLELNWKMSVCYEIEDILQRNFMETIFKFSCNIFDQCDLGLDFYSLILDMLLDLISQMKFKEKVIYKDSINEISDKILILIKNRFEIDNENMEIFLFLTLSFFKEVIKGTAKFENNLDFILNNKNILKVFKLLTHFKKEKFFSSLFKRLISEVLEESIYIIFSKHKTFFKIKQNNKREENLNLFYNLLFYFYELSGSKTLELKKEGFNLLENSLYYLKDSFTLDEKCNELIRNEVCQRIVKDSINNCVLPEILSLISTLYKFIRKEMKIQMEVFFRSIFISKLSVPKLANYFKDFKNFDFFNNNGNDNSLKRNENSKSEEKTLCSNIDINMNIHINNNITEKIDFSEKLIVLENLLGLFREPNMIISLHDNKEKGSKCLWDSNLRRSCKSILIELIFSVFETFYIANTFNGTEVKGDKKLLTGIISLKCLSTILMVLKKQYKEFPNSKLSTKDERAFEFFERVTNSNSITKEIKIEENLTFEELTELEDTKLIAFSIYHNKNYNHKKIAKYFLNKNEKNQKVFGLYLNLKCFKDLRFDLALKNILETINVVGFESQQVELLLKRFVDKYISDNLDLNFENSYLYDLSYNFVFLHTISHNKNVDKKISFEEFYSTVNESKSFNNIYNNDNNTKEKKTQKVFDKMTLKIFYETFTKEEIKHERHSNIFLEFRKRESFEDNFSKEMCLKVFKDVKRSFFSVLILLFDFSKEYKFHYFDTKAFYFNHLNYYNEKLKFNSKFPFIKEKKEENVIKEINYKTERNDSEIFNEIKFFLSNFNKLLFFEYIKNIETKNENISMVKKISNNLLNNIKTIEKEINFVCEE